MYCQLDWPVCACIGTCLTKYAPKVLKKSCVLLNPPCSEPASEIVLAMELGWKWFKKDKSDTDEILYFAFENIMLALMILRDKFFDLLLVMINIVIILVDHLYHQSTNQTMTS